MADKATLILLHGLRRAAADPAGLPLHAGKSYPGLFTPNASGKAIAQRCLDEGLLRVVGAETRGKGVVELCALSDKGLAYLLEQVSPRHVLEDFIRTLEARQGEVAELVAVARRMQAGLDALRDTAARVLARMDEGALGAEAAVGANGDGEHPDELGETVVAVLGDWQAAGAAGDCPLPELYRRLAAGAPELTVGRFHDVLRELYGRERIYLHPWTGPRHDIPEPALALLVGHDIAYYASTRKESSAAPPEGTGL